MLITCALGREQTAWPARPLEQIWFAFDINAQPRRAEQMSISGQVEPGNLGLLTYPLTGFAHVRHGHQRNGLFLELLPFIAAALGNPISRLRTSVSVTSVPPVKNSASSAAYFRG